MDGMNLTLEFEDNVVRVVGTEAAPQWVAKDVCRALGIQLSGSTLTDFPDDEKGRYKISTLGGEQDMVTLTEAGLYRLLFSSNKPEAERFRRWVFHDVLPSLRKTGQYAMQTDPILAMLESARDTRLAQINLENEHKKLDVKVNAVAAVAETAVIKADAAMHTVTGAPNYLALVGFCTENGLKLSEQELAKEGRRLSGHIKKNGLTPPKSIPHQKYGHQNAYPVDVLESWWHQDYLARNGGVA